MQVVKKHLLCAMINAELDNSKLSQKSGVSANQISNIRQGRNTTYETVSKLAAALGVSVSDLVDDATD